jgi:hypothetical protein
VVQRGAFLAAVTGMADEVGDVVGDVVVPGTFARTLRTTAPRSCTRMTGVGSWTRAQRSPS